MFTLLAFPFMIFFVFCMYTVLKTIDLTHYARLPDWCLPKLEAMRRMKARAAKALRWVA